MVFFSDVEEMLQKKLSEFHCVVPDQKAKDILAKLEIAGKQKELLQDYSSEVQPQDTHPRKTG